MRLYLDDWGIEPQKDDDGEEYWDFADFTADDKGRYYLDYDFDDPGCLDEVAQGVAGLFKKSSYYKGAVQNAFGLFGICLTDALDDSGRLDDAVELVAAAFRESPSGKDRVMAAFEMHGIYLKQGGSK